MEQTTMKERLEAYSKRITCGTCRKWRGCLERHRMYPCREWERGCVEHEE